MFEYLYYELKTTSQSSRLFWCILINIVCVMIFLFSYIHDVSPFGVSYTWYAECHAKKADVQSEFLPGHYCSPITSQVKCARIPELAAAIKSRLDSKLNVSCGKKGDRQQY